MLLPILSGAKERVAVHGLFFLTWSLMSIANTMPKRGLKDFGTSSYDFS